MNTEFKNTNILESSASLLPVPTFNNKNADLLCGLAFFIPIPP